MIIRKADEATEAGMLPSAAQLDDMERFSQESGDEGCLNE
jgi:hypothetical protein